MLNTNVFGPSTRFDSQRLRTGTDRNCARPLVCALALFAITVISARAAQDQPGPYKYNGEIHFDLKSVPFSRFGSYLSISDLSEFQLPLRRKGLYLRTMHEDGKNAFQLQLMDGETAIPFTTSATPILLTLSSSGPSVEICFQGPNRLRIRGRGAGLRLALEGGWLVPYQHGHWEVNTSAMKYMIFSIQGELKVSETEGDQDGRIKTLTLMPATGASTFEGELDAYTTGWNSHEPERTFDDAKSGERLAYQHWLDTMPQVSNAFGSGAELAAYVNWESVVSPNHNLKRPAMLMSKNWMESVWSWDHAFNAMATSLSDANLAWDQFLLPFDVQDVEGALPDKWDADSIAWEFSKPPIQGWALSWMFRNGQFPDKKHLAQIYRPLERWTEWYFRYRDSNHDGLPEYRHGNESGWDNSTVFNDGTPLESPDLSALLSVQMQTLAKIATRLGKPTEAKAWNQRSDELLARMLDRFWRDGEFVAIRVADEHPIHSRSLLLYMPIILGTRLPVAVRIQLVAELKRQAATSPFGLPSEPMDSPFYQRDGYWRGPIWAPATLLIASGLDEIGERAFSKELKERFCEMAQRNGMAENFDAESGVGLRDPAYTWTSSVYLLIAHDLGKHHK